MVTKGYQKGLYERVTKGIGGGTGGGCVPRGQSRMNPGDLHGPFDSAPGMLLKRRSSTVLLPVPGCADPDSANTLCGRNGQPCNLPAAEMLWKLER